MFGERPVVGPGLSPEKQHEFEQILPDIDKAGRFRLPEELERGPEEVQLIKLVNRYLAEIMEELALQQRSIPPEQFHFFSREKLHGDFPDEEDVFGIIFETAGMTEGITRRIRIIKSAGGYGVREIKTLLHEALHATSFRRLYMDGRQQEPMPWKLTRTGYSVGNPVDLHTHFIGLDEGVTDKMAMECIMKHKRDFDTMLGEGVADDYLGKKHEPHDGFIRVLDLIMQGIGRSRDEPAERVWERFKRGHFTGEMTHLGDVDKVFGRGALRVLAILGQEARGLKRTQIIEKVFRYFETDDKKERDRIARFILPERERLQYLKRA